MSIIYRVVTIATGNQTHMETGERTTVFAQMWQPTIIKQPLFITVLEIT